MSDDAKTCFIAMPVTTTAEQGERYGDADHWNHVMETLFVPAIEAAGFQALRPISTGSDYIQAEIVRQLESADMVLCDMSHNNANVFFELGVRTSVNKPVALVRCDRSVPIPFDVNSINTHTYDPRLKAWHIEPQVEALAEHLRQAEEGCAGENPMWRQFGLQLKAKEPTAEGTQEEALLGVLANRVSDLSQQVSRMASVNDASQKSVGARWSPSDDLDQVFDAVRRAADRSGVMVKAMFGGEGSQKFRVSVEPPSAQAMESFRERLDAVEALTGRQVVVRVSADDPPA